MRLSQVSVRAAFVLFVWIGFCFSKEEESVWSVLPSPDGNNYVSSDTTYGVLDSSLVSTTQKSFLLLGGYRTIDDIVSDSAENITLNEISNELWEFTISQGSDDVVWKKLVGKGDAPPPMAKHKAFWIESSKEMIVFGGFYQIEQRLVPANSDMYSFFLAETKWVRHTNVSGLDTIYAFDNAAVYITKSNSIFQYGGSHFDGVLSDNIASFDLASRKWSSLDYNRSLPNPGPRQHHGMAYHAKYNKVYMYGGTNWTRANPWASPNDYLNDFWEFDLTLNTWKQLNYLFNLELPSIGEFSMLIIDSSSQLMIFGGCLHKALTRGFESSCAQVSNQLLTYNIETTKMLISETKFNLTRHSFALLFDINFFFGGLTDGGAFDTNLNNFMIIYGPKIMPFQNGTTDENGIYYHPAIRPKIRDWTNFSGAIGSLITFVAFSACVIAFIVKKRRKQKKAYLQTQNL